MVHFAPLAFFPSTWLHLAEMLVAVGQRLGLDVSYQGERSTSV